MDKDKLFLKYLKQAQIQMECTYSGDYKLGNKASTDLEKYNNLIIQDFNNYREVIDKLLQSSNPNVIIWISVVAFKLKYNVDFVTMKLKEISSNKTLGIIRFDAEMTLKTNNLL